ncbi:hypothetical protein N6T38_02115 [Pseudomonas aeruginosa]|nr:hypothetical protein [Pseudomonas aeruginosa]UXJ46502.1 hypothetical protein N6T38_02115 [Pseudomonas aeruginosa]
MGFYIECYRGAEIVHAGKTSTISPGEIQQVVHDTTQVSAPVQKGADEVRRATFAATTAQGKFTWYVFFSTGDAHDCVDDVALVSAPSDVVVQVNPEFKIRDADS